MFDQIENKLKNSKKVIKTNLLSLLNGKNKNKQIYIVTRLIENKKNSAELDDILITIHNNKKCKNIDVYYEEGEDF
jgi:hypothetical protein